MAAVRQTFNCFSRCVTVFSNVRTNRALFRISTNVPQQWIAASLFSTSQVHCLKEIAVKTEGDVTTIEGIYKDDPNKEHVLDLEQPFEKSCTLCPHRLKMDIKYTDVLILSQFVRSDGCLLPRRVTGNCLKAQNKLAKLVHRAQRAGLMPELRPELADGTQRASLKSIHKWRRYNIYYED